MLLNQSHKNHLKINFHKKYNIGSFFVFIRLRVYDFHLVDTNEKRSSDTTEVAIFFIIIIKRRDEQDVCKLHGCSEQLQCHSVF